MILNKDVHFEERMMCILNKYKHKLIDRCHFLALGICLSKGCKACAGGTKHLLSVCLLYSSVNYVYYLFKLSDATMDCSACYIKPFCCEKSHLFNSFQLRQTYLLCISLTRISFVYLGMLRTEVVKNARLI